MRRCGLTLYCTFVSWGRVCRHCLLQRCSCKTCGFRRFDSPASLPHDEAGGAVGRGRTHDSRDPVQPRDLGQLVALPAGARVEISAKSSSFLRHRFSTYSDQLHQLPVTVTELYRSGLYMIKSFWNPSLAILGEYSRDLCRRRRASAETAETTVKGGKRDHDANAFLWLCYIPTVPTIHIAAIAAGYGSSRTSVLPMPFFRPYLNLPVDDCPIYSEQIEYFFPP